MTLSDVRSIIAIIGGGFCAYAICALLPFTGLTLRDFGVAAAVTALCWLLHGLLKFVDSQSYHPNSQHRRTP